VETFDLANRAASIIPSLVHSTTFNLERFAELPMLNFSTATELANFLVAKHNVPFRESHHIVGSLVGKLHSAGKNLSATDDVMAHLASRDLQSVARADVERVLDPKNVMNSYESRGGTGPKSVATMMEKMKADLAASKKILATDVERTETANAAIHAIAASASRDPQALTQQGLRDIVKNLHPLKNYVAPN
jgi:argininosuccinate lyase